MQRHSSNADNNSTSYVYYKNTSASFEAEDSVTLLDGIQDEDWDIITLNII